MMAQNEKTDILYLGFVLGHGGDAIQMLELASGIQKRGRSVKIMVPLLPSSESLEERCRERGIAIERTSLMHADAFAARHNFISLIRLFAKNRASVVHVHTGDVCLPRAVLLAAALTRTRHLCATLQSPYDYLSSDGFRAKSWAMACGSLVKKTFCPSRHSYDAQIRYGVNPECVQVIYNSVDLDAYRGGNAEAAFQTLGLPFSTPLVVFSSRLEPQKRPDDALQAFLKVAEKHPEAHFAFVGSGSMEKPLREIAVSSPFADRVHFVGYQQNVPDWLKAATVWSFPTESENFSLALLEALGAGCPILSTLCQGNDEVLVDEENALTTDVGDVAAQAVALDRLLSDSLLRSKLSERALQSSERYSADHMTEEYAAYYDPFLDSTALTNSVPQPAERG